MSNIVLECLRKLVEECLDALNTVEGVPLDECFYPCGTIFSTLKGAGLSFVYPVRKAVNEVLLDDSNVERQLDAVSQRLMLLNEVLNRTVELPVAILKSSDLCVDGLARLKALSLQHGYPAGEFGNTLQFRTQATLS